MSCGHSGTHAKGGCVSRRASTGTNTEGRRGRGRDESALALKASALGIPWRSSCWESVLPLQGAPVPSLVGGLKSCMLRGAAKKNPRKQKKLLPQNNIHDFLSHFIDQIQSHGQD